MQRLVRRLDSRLFLSHLLVAGAALLLVALIILATLLPLQYELTYRQLTDAVLPGLLIARTTPQPLARLESHRDTRLAELLSEQATTQSIRLLVIERDSQTVRYDSNGELSGDVWPSDINPERPSRFPLLWQRLAQLPGAARGRVRLEGEAWLYVAIPLQANNRDTGLFLAALAPRPTLRDAIRPLVGLQILLLLISLFALVLLLSAWLSRTISGALAPVIAGTHALAQGDLAHRVTVTRHAFTEAAQLADSFNRMADEVEQSRHAQRAFVANVGHDLKTPLTSIQGFAQALDDGTITDPAQAARAASIIQQESQRLGKLVDELLDLARLDADRLALQRSRVDLGALVTRLTDDYQTRSEDAQINLKWAAPSAPIWLDADVDRLTRSIRNLLDNAFTHTQPQGEITLDLQTIIQADESWVELGIADTGPGIAPAEQPYIFDRFYQVDKARSGPRGTGLGLAIVRELIEAHGGQVGVTSIPHVGSRFWLRLPRGDNLTP